MGSPALSPRSGRTTGMLVASAALAAGQESGSFMNPLPPTSIFALRLTAGIFLTWLEG
jgi:hypothetical protein